MLLAADYRSLVAWGPQMCEAPSHWACVDVTANTFLDAAYGASRGKVGTQCRHCTGKLPSSVQSRRQRDSILFECVILEM